MANVGIQLYSLRNVDRPLPALLERVAEAGFEGVEFAYRVYDADPETVERTLERTGLRVAGAHVSTDRLEDDLEDTVTLLRSLGCETLTVPGLPEEYFQSLDGVEQAADRLASIAGDLDGYDIDLLYHNHEQEFVDLDGRFALERLFERTGRHVRPQLDLGTALLGGADPAALIRRLEDVPQVHFKDVDLGSGDSVPVGHGDVDIDACASAASAVGSEWSIYEYEGEDPLETLEEAATTLLNRR